MKKVILSAVVAAALLTSCGAGSAKGNWTDSDKEKFDAEMDKVSESLEPFGEHKQAFLDCYYEKLEEGYANFNEANTDVEGCKTLAQDCAKEVMGM